MRSIKAITALAVAATAALVTPASADTRDPVGAFFQRLFSGQAESRSQSTRFDSRSYRSSYDDDDDDGSSNSSSNSSSDSSSSSNSNSSSNSSDDDDD